MARRRALPKVTEGALEVQLLAVLVNNLPSRAAIFPIDSPPPIPSVLRDILLSSAKKLNIPDLRLNEEACRPAFDVGALRPDPYR